MSRNDFKTIVSQFYREGKRKSIHANINVFITFPSAIKLMQQHTNNIWWEEKQQRKLNSQRRCCFLFCHWLLLLSRYRFICACLQFLLSKKKKNPVTLCQMPIHSFIGREEVNVIHKKTKGTSLCPNCPWFDGWIVLRVWISCFYRQLSQCWYRCFSDSV